MNLGKTNVNSFPPQEIYLCSIEQRDWDDLFVKISKNCKISQFFSVVCPIILGAGIPMIFDSTKNLLGVLMVVIGIAGTAFSVATDTTQMDKVKDRAQFIDKKAKDYAKQNQEEE